MLVLFTNLLLLLILYTGTPVRAESNEAVQNKIKEYWNANGVPTDILKKTSKVKPFRFAYATPEAVRGKVKCVLAEHDYCKKLGPATFYYDDGSYDKTVYKVEEKPGVLTVTLNGTKYEEHVLFFKDHVFAFFKSAVGSPAFSNIAIVAVDPCQEDCPETKAALKEARDLLTQYGVTGLREVPACPEILHAKKSEECVHS